jgi:hypothetical protein
MERYLGKRGQWIEESIADLGSPEDYTDYAVNGFIVSGTKNGKQEKIGFEAFYRGASLGRYARKSEALATIKRHKEDEDRRSRKRKDDDGPLDEPPSGLCRLF